MKLLLLKYKKPPLGIQGFLGSWEWVVGGVGIGIVADLFV